MKDICQIDTEGFERSGLLVMVSIDTVNFFDYYGHVGLAHCHHKIISNCYHFV
jgi:hypothetical protein